MSGSSSLLKSSEASGLIYATFCLDFESLSVDSFVSVTYIDNSLISLSYTKVTSY